MTVARQPLHRSTARIGCCLLRFSTDRRGMARKTDGRGSESAARADTPSGATPRPQRFLDGCGEPVGAAGTDESADVRASENCRSAAAHNSCGGAGSLT
jgi:hypothetical protein